MATAVLYDDWEDPGLGFSEAEIKAYQPKACAAARVNALLEMFPAVLRRSELGEKPQWWARCAAKMLDTVTWYCVASGLPGIDREAVHSGAAPDDPKVQKHLTLIARQLGSEEEFLQKWRSEVRSVLIQHVSLGRRCSSARAVSGWTKADKSNSNRVANAVHREYKLIDVLETELYSLSVRKESAS